MKEQLHSKILVGSNILKKNGNDNNIHDFCCYMITASRNLMY